MRSKALMNGRMTILYFFFLFVGICLLIKIMTLQYVKGDKLRQLWAEVESEMIDEIPSTRGSIISMDGTIWRYSMPKYNLDWSITRTNPLQFDRSVNTLADSLYARRIMKSSREEILSELIDAKYGQSLGLLLTHSSVSKEVCDEIMAIPLTPSSRAALYAEKNKKRFKVRIRPHEMSEVDIPALASHLERILGEVPAPVMEQKLRSARDGKKWRSSFVFQNLSMDNLKWLQSFALLADNTRFYSVSLSEERVRLNPMDSLARRTIGDFGYKEGGTEKEGLFGVEGTFENYLRDEPGRMIVKKMAGGVMVPIQMEDSVRNGKDVVITINPDYQTILQEELRRQIDKYHAYAGCAVMMEVKSGRLVGMANCGGLLGARNIQAFREEGYTPDMEIYNHALQTATSPGSVFKAATMICFLEDQLYMPDQRIDLGKSGEYKFRRGTTIKESHGGLGEVTVREAFAKSANGFSWMADEKYYQTKKERLFYDRLLDMGWGKPLGVMGGESSGYLPNINSRNQWHLNSVPSIAIGYEVQSTPVQMLAFYNAIANDGYMKKPYLVERVENNGLVTSTLAPSEEPRRLYNDATNRNMKMMLRSVVTEGTGRQMEMLVDSVSGKTGTSRLRYLETSEKEPVYQATFVGYFPKDDPLYSCIVTIYAPDAKLGYYGSTVAGNAFKNIVRRLHPFSAELCARQQGLSPADKVERSKVGVSEGYRTDMQTMAYLLGTEVPDGKNIWTVVKASDNALYAKDLQVSKVVMPSVEGMGMRDVLFLLEETCGMVVQVSGTGVVKQQIPAAGAPIERGETAVLTFE